MNTFMRFFLGIFVGMALMQSIFATFDVLADGRMTVEALHGTILVTLNLLVALGIFVLYKTHPR